MYMIGSSRLDFVVDSYYHAITAKFPRARYHPGLDSKFFYMPLTLLPTELHDFILRKVVGAISMPGILEKKPQEVYAKKLE